MGELHLKENKVHMMQLLYKASFVVPFIFFFFFAQLVPVIQLLVEICSAGSED